MKVNFINVFFETRKIDMFDCLEIEKAGLLFFVENDG